MEISEYYRKGIGAKMQDNKKPIIGKIELANIQANDNLIDAIKELNRTLEKMLACMSIPQHSDKAYEKAEHFKTNGVDKILLLEDIINPVM